MLRKINSSRLNTNYDANDYKSEPGTYYNVYFPCPLTRKDETAEYANE